MTKGIPVVVAFDGFGAPEGTVFSAGIEGVVDLTAIGDGVVEVPVVDILGAFVEDGGTSPV